MLAAFALSMLLVQPICEAHEANAADSAACCVAIAEAALVDFDSAAAMPAGKPSPAFPIAGVLSSSWRTAAHDSAAVAPPDPPLVPLPYHVRSARILS